MTKNNFEQLDNEFNSQVIAVGQDFKQNKEKVIDFLLDNLMNVHIELPDNVRRGGRGGR